MTVNVNDRRRQYPGNGIATVFNGPMAYERSHIQAYLVDTTTFIPVQVPGSAFTVQFLGRNNGTRVVMSVAPPVGQTLLLLRVVPEAQTVDITNQSSFNASVVELALDLLAMQIQQNSDQMNYVLKFPDTSIGITSSELPVPVPSVLFGLNDTATAVRYYTLTELANFIAYGDKTVVQFLGVPDGVNGINQDFPLGQDPGSIGNLDVEFDGVGQKNGIDFTYVGSTIHFTVPPPSGTEIQIRFDQAVPVGTGLASAITYQAPGAGAVFRSMQAKLREDYAISARDYGAVGDGVADDLAALNLAIAYLNSSGGGILDLGRGKYRISDEWVLGDGSALQVSTKDHRITIRGAGKGSDEFSDFVQQEDPCEIIYDGPLSINKAVLRLQGPLHHVNVEGVMLNCNNKAGVGLYLNHVADSNYYCFTKRYIYAGFVLTTQSTTPPGCAYGCANNTFYQCTASVPGPGALYGVVMTSGSPGAGPINGDAANNDFFGGAFWYPGNVGTAGFYIEGADNNTIYGSQSIAVSPNDSLGKSIFFAPWPGDPRFPLENCFYNVGMNQAMGGVSGTLGNVVVVHQEGDSGSYPLIDNVQVFGDHTGKCAINGVRGWRTRNIAVARIAPGGGSSTTSNVFVDVPGMSVTINNVKALSKLRISVGGRIGKNATGTGSFILVIDGVAQGATTQEVGATSYFHNFAIDELADVGAGNHTIKLQYLSSDANATSLQNGTLVVEEYF